MAEMSAERLAEIRERAERCKFVPDHPGSMFTWQDSAQDVPDLLAEVERLRAELARWDGHDAVTATLVQQAETERDEAHRTAHRDRLAAQGAVDRIEQLTGERDQAERDVDRLTSERDAARAELRTAKDGRAHAVAEVARLVKERDKDRADLEDLRAERDALTKQVKRVRDLHPKDENPRHGCCAEPKVCKGHAPECRGWSHGLSTPTWPCADIRALDGEASRG